MEKCPRELKSLFILRMKNMLSKHMNILSLYNKFALFGSVVSRRSTEEDFGSNTGAFFLL